MDRKSLIDQVLALLEVWVVRNKEYDKLNDQLSKLNELPTHLNLMDDQLHAPLYQLFDELLMRPDERRSEKDVYIKQDMLNDLKQDYEVVLAVDDRDQVVQMWRENGIRCLQVAEGDF